MGAGLTVGPPPFPPPRTANFRPREDGWPVVVETPEPWMRGPWMGQEAEVRGG